MASPAACPRREATGNWPVMTRSSSGSVAVHHSISVMPLVCCARCSVRHRDRSTHDRLHTQAGTTRALVRPPQQRQRPRLVLALALVDWVRLLARDLRSLRAGLAPLCRRLRAGVRARPWLDGALRALASGFFGLSCGVVRLMPELTESERSAVSLRALDDRYEACAQLGITRGHLRVLLHALAASSTWRRAERAASR